MTNVFWLWAMSCRFTVPSFDKKIKFDLNIICKIIRKKKWLIGKKQFRAPSHYTYREGASAKF